MTTHDVIIIGAGIAGASAAYQLAAERNVLVLEAESQPGFHATGRSAAFYSETYGNDVIRALTSAGREFFENPPAEYFAVPLLTSSGALFIGRANQQAALERHYRDTARPGCDVRLESADFALTKCPGLRRDYVAGCVWEPQSRAIDVAALLQGFLKGAKARGATLKTDAAVTDLKREKGSWRVTAGGMEFTAPQVINAAGAWADPIAALAGLAPKGIVPLRRSIAVINGPKEGSPKDWPLTLDVDEDFYFKPDGDRLWLSPADETPMPAGDVYPEDMDIAEAAQKFEQATTMKVERVFQSWAGLRSFAPDRVPVVGFDEEAEGFFWLAGQGGYGIQTSPALARLVKAMVLQKPCPTDLETLDLKRLSPARF